MPIQGLLHAGHGYEHVACMDSLDPHNNPMRGLLNNSDPIL